MLQRASFIGICFNVEDFPGIQLIILNLLNLAFCIYYGMVQPLDTLTKRRLALFNQFSLLVISWHMMCFTDFVVEADT